MRGAAFAVVADFAAAFDLALDAGVCAVVVATAHTNNPKPAGNSHLARISHQLSAAARDKAASTSLRFLTVRDVLFEYASAR